VSRHTTPGTIAKQTEQKYFPEKEFQKAGLSAQAPSSSTNDTVATAVHQIMTVLSKAMSEDRVTIFTKFVLDLMQQNDC
jgi:L-asparaginase/Glu-tRNA(Gln) amidotransferase subunit D